MIIASPRYSRNLLIFLNLLLDPFPFERISPQSGELLWLEYGGPGSSVATSILYLVHVSTHGGQSSWRLPKVVQIGIVGLVQARQHLLRDGILDQDLTLQLTS